MKDDKRPAAHLYVHPAPPTSLVQEIPTPDVVHTVDSVMGDAETMREQGRGSIRSDVLGSYTGAPEQDLVPEQDADDL